MKVYRENNRLFVEFNDTAFTLNNETAVSLIKALNNLYGIYEEKENP